MNRYRTFNKKITKKKKVIKKILLFKHKIFKNYKLNWTLK